MPKLLRCKKSLSFLLGALFVGTVLMAFAATTSASDTGFGMWRASSLGSCGPGMRCAEWCEFDGTSMAGTGQVCCIPANAIGTDDGVGCSRPVH